jgi:hypothetical protein
MPFTGLNKATGLMDTFKYLETLYWDVIKDMPFAKKAQILRSYPILFGKPAVKAMIRYLLRREVVVSDWRLDVEKNPMTYEELERDAQGWISGWAKQFDIKNLADDLTEENRKGRKIRVKVMQEIVDFCIERGYRPVYVIPPVTKFLSSWYTEKFKKLFFYDFLQFIFDITHLYQPFPPRRDGPFTIKNAVQLCAPHLYCIYYSIAVSVRQHNIH